MPTPALTSSVRDAIAHAVDTTRYAYVRAETVDQVLDLLAEGSGDSRVLAGGQSLIPLLRSGMYSPAKLIDINRLADLSYIERDGETLRIGALTRTRDIERSDIVRAYVPLLSDAIACVAYPQVRNRGTIGGNLAHGDPAAQIGAAMLALDGEIVARRKGTATRTIAAADFFKYWFETTLDPDELLVEIVVPIRSARSGWSYGEVAQPPGSPVHAGVATRVTLGHDGAIADAAIAFIGVAATPIRIAALDDRLKGATFDAALLDAVIAAIDANLEPIGDAIAPSDYRKHVATVLTRRSLEQAVARAREAATP